MSDNTPTKWQRRAGLPALSKKEHKAAIHTGMKRDQFTQTLDIFPDFYETRIATFIRILMRMTHDEP